MIEPPRAPSLCYGLGLLGIALSGCLVEAGQATESGLDAGVGARDGAAEEGGRALLDAQLAESHRDASSADPSEDAEPLGEQPERGRLAGITAAHNAARGRVLASPTLPPLAWSPKLAAQAQAYAERLAQSCTLMLTHSSAEERMQAGENLAAFSDRSAGATRSPGSAREVVALWESELACYSFGPFQSGVHERCTSTCAKYGGCGHYTQLVWRDTRELGCGFAECTEQSQLRSFWVCHYDPPGNVQGALPY